MNELSLYCAYSSFHSFNEKKMNNELLIFFFWSGLLDSNQRPRAPQTCALPTALNPDPFSLGN